jgi:ribosomal protein L17
MLISLSPEDREFLEYCYAEWSKETGHGITSKTALKALSDQTLIDLIHQEIPTAIQLCENGGFAVICKMIERSGDPYAEVPVLSLL